MAVERHGKSIIAHGLGNFLFERGEYLEHGHHWTDRSFVLHISLSKRGVHRAELIPIELGAGPSARLMRGRRRYRFLQHMALMAERLQDTAALERFEFARSAYEG